MPMPLPLFPRHLRFAVLGSGSSGNCTYIGDRQSGVLIDCGLSTKQIKARMAAVGLQDAPIDAVLITHEHSDHVGAARILCRNLPAREGRTVPFFFTQGTHVGTDLKSCPDAVEIIEPNEPFQIGHLQVEPFSVPHDTLDPVAWRVNVDGQWAGVITDLGRPTTLVAEKLRSLSVAVVEFNHDVEMLNNGPHPWQVKQRVRSNHGHLSNEQAAELLRLGLGPNLRHLVLGHLSQHNNTPALAERVAVAALAEIGASPTLWVGDQHSPLRVEDLPTAAVA